LLAAVQYFTCLPVPACVGHDQTLLDDATRYLPAVGVLVGGIGALTLMAAQLLWSEPVALVVSMLATIVVTGAFHEDGLADTVDGLGGGRTAARALEIMKDSRIGAFGAIALVLALLLKYAALASVPARNAAVLLITGHAASRAAAVLVMIGMNYVREGDQSRTKPVVQNVSPVSVVIAIGTSVVAAIPSGPRALIGGGAVAVFVGCWRWYLRRRLNGYTGDCLGAAQQIAECCFYLACTNRL
jgi:adenosylcobinamide-GDP ribazoletransferase